jgi:hypothetical protein
MRRPFYRDLGRLARLASVTLALAWVAPAPGQGTKADYERSANLRTRVRDKVFRDRVEPTWSKDGKRMWYRVRTGADRHEFVLVDVAKGARRRAFDHEKLAEALIGAGVDGARADRLPITRLDLDRHPGSIGLSDRVLVVAVPPEGLSPGQGRRRAGGGQGRHTSRRRRRASRLGRHGPEVHVTFLNRTKGEVELFWLDRSGNATATAK